MLDISRNGKLATVLNLRVTFYLLIRQVIHIQDFNCFIGNCLFKDQAIFQNERENIANKQNTNIFKSKFKKQRWAEIQRENNLSLLF